MNPILDPYSAGILSMGAGLLGASGPSRMPISLGQALGGGMQSGLGAMQNAQALQMQQELQQAQLGHLKTQDEMARAKALREAKLLEMRGNLFGLPGVSPTDALSQGAAMGDVGPTNTNAARIQPGDPNALNPVGVRNYLMAGGSPKDIEAMMNIGPRGTLGKINPADYTPDSFKKYLQTGNAGDLNPARKMEIASNGVAYNPYATPAGATFNDPNKAFNIGGNGEAVPNLPFQNYQLNKANAGATRVQNNVNAFTPASVAAQTEFMKSARTTYDQLKQAPVMLQSIEKAKELIPGAAGFMGPGGETLLDAAKFLNNRIGTNINTEGVKDAEELRTRIFFNIMDNLKKMDAQPSQQQQQIMQDALGKLGTDPNALPKVLDAFSDVIKGKVALHNQEMQSAESRGVKFPYDPVIKLPDAPSAEKPAQAVMESMPKANMQNKGKVLVDTTTGKRFKSNGMQWVETK